MAMAGAVGGCPTPTKRACYVGKSGCNICDLLNIVIAISIVFMFKSKIFMEILGVGIFIFRVCNQIW